MTAQRHEERKREQRRAAREEAAKEPIDTQALSRGICLHYIRIGLRTRGSVATRRTVHAYADRGQWVGLVRECVRDLRALGAGPVEPVRSAGGELTVPETWWGPMPCESCSAPAVGRSLDDVPLCGPALESSR